MSFAQRMTRLGTENAFAVAARAAKHIAEGHEVFPFHLGDLNFQTPEFIVKAANKAIVDGKTGYCPAAGIMPLREALAENINQDRNTSYTAENILIQTGGKPVIAKFILAFMNEGDEVLFPNPGFPIYESQIEFLGGKAVPYSYIKTENGFKIDLETLENSITEKTKLIIINDFHNPTGAECSEEERLKLAKLIVKHNLMALIDEAYFEIRYQGKSNSILSLPDMDKHCVMLYTFSKKFAMTGWRVGAMVCPTEYVDMVARLNVNVESCTSHFSQYGVLEALLQKEQAQNALQSMLRTLKERRDLAVEMLNEINGISCAIPQSAFYLFPEITGLMNAKGFDNYADFREDLLLKTGVSLCTREHFGKILPSEIEAGTFFARLAYSGIDTVNIKKALGKLQDYARN